MADTTVRCPDVTVPLTGITASLMVIALVQRELRRAGHQNLVAEFTAEATSSDWDHLVSTVAAWVHVC